MAAGARRGRAHEATQPGGGLGGRLGSARPNGWRRARGICNSNRSRGLVVRLNCQLSVPASVSTERPASRSPTRRALMGLWWVRWSVESARLVLALKKSYVFHASDLREGSNAFCVRPRRQIVVATASCDGLLFVLLDTECICATVHTAHFQARFQLLAALTMLLARFVLRAADGSASTHSC
jgi:hypothetical protein